MEVGNSSLITCLGLTLYQSKESPGNLGNSDADCEGGFGSSLEEKNVVTESTVVLLQSAMNTTYGIPLVVKWCCGYCGL